MEGHKALYSAKSLLDIHWKNSENPSDVETRYWLRQHQNLRERNTFWIYHLSDRTISQCDSLEENYPKNNPCDVDKVNLARVPYIAKFDRAMIAIPIINCQPWNSLSSRTPESLFS